MRRAAKWLGGVIAVLVLLPVLTVALVLGVLNTAAGDRLLERLTTRFTGGMVTLQNVGGRFPQAPRVGRLEIRDAQGVWLSLEDLQLDWSPLQLARREVRIERLAAARASMPRLPGSSGSSSSRPGSSPTDLPVRVVLERLHVDRVEIGAPVAGVAAVLAVDGHASVASMQQGDADVTIRQVGDDGTYHLQGRIDADGLLAAVEVQEPARGLVSSVAKLPELGALSVKANLDGPWTGAAMRLSLSAGPLTASARGSVNIAGQAADLDVDGAAPAMAPRPDLSWQKVALEAHVHGPFTRPQVRGNLQIDALQAAGAEVARLVAQASGDAGRVAVQARAEGVRIPGPRPDLLQSAPVTLDVSARLDAPDRPVAFALAHPLLDVKGTAHTVGPLSADAALQVPDLAPLAAVGGVDLQGRTALQVHAEQAGETSSVAVDGTIGITGGMAPLPALVGPEAKLRIIAALHGSDVGLSRLELDGHTLTVSAVGGLQGGVIGLDWKLAFADLREVAAQLQGSVQAQGRVQGKTDDLAVQAELNGEIAAAGVPRGPVKATLRAQGLPGAPSGQVLAEGTLDGAPLALDAAVQRAADGTLSLAINRADWKSAHAEGGLSLPPQARLPQGKLAVRMTRLADLRGLLGQPLGGSVTADIDAGQDGAVALTLEARDAGLAGSAGVGRANLTARIANPLGERQIAAKLTVQDVRAGGIAGDMRLDANGKDSAMALKLAATLPNFQGAALQADSAAMLDVSGKTLSLSSLVANWKGQSLRLLAPARVAFGDGLVVDRARLGVGGAVLEVAGRISPALDLAASLRNVTPELARPFLPDLQATGTMEADAQLAGTPDRPTGKVRLSISRLHRRVGPGASLPPASLTATVELAGTLARLDVNASVGRNRLTLSGTAPIDPAGRLDLRAAGSIDLTVLDPILLAAGRQVRGQVTLDARITGTAAAPLGSGTIRLANGEVQDFVQGVHITDIAGLIEANGDAIRITRLTGKAGQGSIGASGTVGLGGAMPVDLRVIANRARPLASDRLTVLLDGNVAVRGEVRGSLAVSGTVGIERADIGIPETMPIQVPTLNVRMPGQKPPPPPAPAPDITLDLTLNAPQQIFVRGRGLYAELGGRLHIGGTVNAPQPSGSFNMRQGNFNLAGQTLTFTTGRVGFDGSGRLDPTLNFVATSTNGSIVATLTVAGYASSPKISLSSVPELPQDEILAQLLFRQSASSLSPFQLAEIAAGLAQISGVGGGFDPLNKIRRSLGLDRLAVGSGGKGASPALEAGSYLARGLYIGARQATVGGGAQATVQLDLAPGLKLQTVVGSGAGNATGAGSTATQTNGANIGLTYEFQY